jgi:hypothetical protein
MVGLGEEKVWLWRVNLCPAVGRRHRAYDEVGSSSQLWKCWRDRQTPRSFFGTFSLKGTEHVFYYKHNVLYRRTQSSLELLSQNVKF